jgi:murein DD-endopeptidase MepM/ murein hydrolase activator NlpD
MVYLFIFAPRVLTINHKRMAKIEKNNLGIIASALTFFLFAICISSSLKARPLSSVSSAYLNKNLPEKDTVSFKPKNIKIKIEEEEAEGFDDVEFLDVNSLLELNESFVMEDPSFDYYGIWDTISVNPYKIDLSRMKDTVMIQLLDDHECDYTHPFCGKVTSNFGPRGRRYHKGIDIDLETGDTVRCAFEGMVRIARRSSTFGNVVIVRHKNGLETVYAHLSKIDVKVGQWVDTGELLGLGGNTGRSRGSHLHFEVRYKGMPINPNHLIDFQENRLKAGQIALNSEFFNYPRYSKKGYQAKNLGSHGNHYVVKKGDTLGRIAQKTGNSVKTLCRLNGLKPNSIIRPGQKLRLA